MKKVLIITKNYLQGVTKAGKLGHVARQGDMEVATISNTRLEEFGYQLSNANIVREVSRSIEEYDLVVIYVGQNAPRFPIQHHDLRSIDLKKLVLVMNCHLTVEEQLASASFAGMDISAGLDRLSVIQTPLGDEGGVVAIMALRQGLLNSGRIDLGNLAKQSSSQA
ncbi:hypothetical protein KW800_02105 [Candidatus Parcubacteria bacterium]|nr:hypothetical protein [Candidatus Parcubacteria bacterium]